MKERTAYRTRILGVLLLTGALLSNGSAWRSAPQGAGSAPRRVTSCARPSRHRGTSAESVARMLRLVEAVRSGEVEAGVAVGRLRRYLDDEDAFVRANAITSLGRIGGPTAAMLLIRKLERGDWRERRCAAEALGWLEPTESVLQALKAALRDGSEWVKIEAGRSLARLAPVGESKFPAASMEITAGLGR